jgi:hypothetical protein
VRLLRRCGIAGCQQASAVRAGPPEIAGLGFAKKDIEDVVREIKADGLLSGHLKILLRKAAKREPALVARLF